MGPVAAALPTHRAPRGPWQHSPSGVGCRSCGRLHLFPVLLQRASGCRSAASATRSGLGVPPLSINAAVSPWFLSLRESFSCWLESRIRKYSPLRCGRSSLTRATLRQTWNTHLLDSGMVYYFHTLPFAAFPAWILSPGATESSFGTAPAAVWKSTNPQSPGNTIDAAGLFTAAGIHATASVTLLPQSPCPMATDSPGCRPEHSTHWASTHSTEGRCGCMRNRAVPGPVGQHMMTIQPAGSPGWAVTDGHSPRALIDEREPEHSPLGHGTTESLTDGGL